MNWAEAISFVLPLAVALLRNLEDGDLIERLRRREAEAAGELYQRYGRTAFSLILRVVRSREVAEELVQETFLRVWNRSQFFDPERGALGAWVLAVARNLAIDHLRSVSGRAWRNETGFGPLGEPAHFSKFGEELEQMERARHVRDALEKLDENQRKVIELAYFEGLSHSEMAERLAEPLGTIKTRVRSALRTLRLALGEVAA